MKWFVRLLAPVLALGLSIAPLEATTGTSASGHSSTHSTSGSTSTKSHSTKSKSKHTSSGTKKSSSTKRDSHGKIARSEAAKHQFEVQSGYPHGRPGYVVDHIKPLACGGQDVPSNMQWQTITAAKVKDKTERVGCP